MTALTVSRRQELEAIIGDAIIGGRSHLRRIADALAEIQDKRLYAPEYETFEAYAAVVWYLTPERARVFSAASRMAQTAATQTTIEDMPLYYHTWFANVVEDVGRTLEDLSPGERAAAITVAKRIGTAKTRILAKVIEDNDATPEKLAALPADEQTAKLRQVNAESSKQYGKEQAAEFVDTLRRRLKKSVEELNKEAALASYLAPGIVDGLRALFALCSPPE